MYKYNGVFSFHSISICICFSLLSISLFYSVIILFCLFFYSIFIHSFIIILGNKTATWRRLLLAFASLFISHILWRCSTLPGMDRSPRIYFFALYIFHIPRCTLPDFPTVSSVASLLFLYCCHRTTTMNRIHGRYVRSKLYTYKLCMIK